MLALHIEEIAQALDGTFVTGREPVDISQMYVTSVSIDSRVTSDHGLFVAIKGEHVDGHDFLQSAARHGYVAALVDHEVKLPEAHDTPSDSQHEMDQGLQREDNPQILQILVPDTVKALGQVAHLNLEHRRALHSPFTIIGITGSVGKTTTKDLTRALLASRDNTVAPQGSFNNDIGLPLTATTVDERTRYFVAEMGASGIGDIARLTTIARPDVGAELRVGTAHVGEFGSVENIFLAKSELVEALPQESGIAILNADDENVARMQDKTQAAHVLWFGITNATHQAQLDVTARNISVDNLDRPSFQLIIEGKLAGDVHLQLSGKHHVMNALAAVSIAHCLGLPDEQIVRVLNSHIPLSPHRMCVREVEVNSKRFTVLDDTFNANPDSMRGGIEGLASLGDENSYRVAVLGPMLELGEESDELHHEVASRVYFDGIDNLIAVGTPSLPEADHLADAYVEGVHQAAQATDIPVNPTQARRHGPFSLTRVKDADEAYAQMMYVLEKHPHALFLLKGSHAAGLSALADRLLRHTVTSADSSATPAAGVNQA